MGFRANSYATFWGEPRRISDTLVTGRISMTRKDQTTGEFKRVFAAPVGFHGTSAASKALQLKERDRIHLIDVDVEDDRMIELPDEKKAKLYRFKIWNFEKVEPLSDGNGHASQQPRATTVNQTVDDLVDGGDGLPF